MNIKLNNLNIIKYPKVLYLIFALLLTLITIDSFFTKNVIAASITGIPNPITSPNLEVGDLFSEEVVDASNQLNISTLVDDQQLAIVFGFTIPKPVGVCESATLNSLIYSYNFEVNRNWNESGGDAKDILISSSITNSVAPGHLMGYYQPVSLNPLDIIGPSSSVPPSGFDGDPLFKGSHKIVDMDDNTKSINGSFVYTSDWSSLSERIKISDLGKLGSSTNGDLAIVTSLLTLADYTPGSYKFSNFSYILNYDDSSCSPTPTPTPVQNSNNPVISAAPASTIKAPKTGAIILSLILTPMLIALAIYLYIAHHNKANIKKRSER